MHASRCGYFVVFNFPSSVRRCGTWSRPFYRWRQQQQVSASSVIKNSNFINQSASLLHASVSSSSSSSSSTTTNGKTSDNKINQNESIFTADDSTTNVSPPTTATLTDNSAPVYNTADKFFKDQHTISSKPPPPEDEPSSLLSSAEHDDEISTDAEPSTTTTGDDAVSTTLLTPSALPSPFSTTHRTQASSFGGTGSAGGIGGGGAGAGGILTKSSSSSAERTSIEDVLFYLFRNEEGKVPVGRFLSSLMGTGLRRSDPRLQEFFRNLRTAPSITGGTSLIGGGSGDAAHSTAGFMLDKDTFYYCIKDNIVLISRAFLNEFVVPEFSDFTHIIEEIYWKCRTNTAGKVADYIPQLARYSPDYWGVSICTVDGQRFSIGDTEVPFCLQSASKPLNYVTALEDLGPVTVHEYVGQEPSGRIFNELVLDSNHKPHNPLINAGAILIISLIQRHMKLADRFDYLLRNYKRMAGNEYVGFSNPTFLSERDTADRNYALGFYMKENHCFPEGSNLQESLDLYFQMCSAEVTCDSGAVIAATMANGGICPITGEKVMKNSSVRDVLSLMYSCGMYDYSGQFAFQVGLPAKSGVSGTILVVVPNAMGIALWSPPLDHYGNSVRGVQFCQELVSRFNFHNFDNIRHTPRKLDPRARNVEAKGLQIVTLLFSAANGDLTSLRRLYLSGMDMSQADYDGRTALHLAASEGHLEVVRMLLTKCNVPHNPKDRWSRTPMDDAKQFGHEAVVQFLNDWNARLAERPH